MFALGVSALEVCVFIKLGEAFLFELLLSFSFLFLVERTDEKNEYWVENNPAGRGCLIGP